MLLRTGMILLLLTGMASAQDVPEAGPDIAGLMQSLPEKTLKKLRSAPDAFLRDAAGLIYGFGSEGGITIAGIDTFIAAERARVRAGEMARYLAGDLDNDGSIARDEILVLSNAAAVGRRGQLWLGFDLADADKDTVVSLAELRSHAQGTALEKMSETDAEVLRGFVVFDLNSDGIVAMAEVSAGVSAMIGSE